LYHDHFERASCHACVCEFRERGFWKCGGAPLSGGAAL
jgi:hypothetical protein